MARENRPSLDYSIQESKHPDWNLVLKGIFDIIRHDKSFLCTFNLFLSFIPTAHLKCHGSMHQIADELGLSVETVRNYFGGNNYTFGESVGIHMEPGPDGGLVELDDTKVLDRAKEILRKGNVD